MKYVYITTNEIIIECDNFKNAIYSYRRNIRRAGDWLPITPLKAYNDNATIGEIIDGAKAVKTIANVNMFE